MSLIVVKKYLVLTVLESSVTKHYNDFPTVFSDDQPEHIKHIYG